MAVSRVTALTWPRHPHHASHVPSTVVSIPAADRSALAVGLSDGKSGMHSLKGIAAALVVPSVALLRGYGLRRQRRHLLTRSAAKSSSAAKKRQVSRRSQEDWETVAEMVFMLRPPAGKKPKAVICFAGGALVGAAPQVTYDRFLRLLADRGYVVLAAGYAACLNYDSCADLLESRFKRALSREDLTSLPVWGLGHSLGALAQVLISSRHPSSVRRGQILLSYTRKGEEALPIVRTAIQSNPILGPLIRALDIEVASNLLDRSYKITEQLLERAGVRARSSSVRLRDLIPVVRQVLPLVREVGTGRGDFRPSSASLEAAVEEGYGERSTLLIRLGDDEIDETAGLVQLLANLPAVRQVNFSMRSMRGAHLMPLLPDWSDAVSSVDGLLSRSGQRPRADQWARAAEGQERVADIIDQFLQSQ